MTAEELHQKIYRKGIIEDWANIVVERFEKAIDKKKIGVTHQLAESLKQRTSFGRIEKVTFSFLKYGRFVDMGVGNHVKIGDIKERRGIHAKALGIQIKRRSKKWYSPVIYGQVAKLAEIIRKKYGKESAEWIAGELNLPLVIEF